MDQKYIEIIGFIAAFCTTVSFIPQIIKLIKTKQVRDISLFMYIVLLIGILLWLIYGIFIKDNPVIIANVLGSIFCFIILIYRIIFFKKD